MRKRTKIVATLGPATDDPKVLTTGVHYVRIIGICQGLMAVEIVLERAFAGAGLPDPIKYAPDVPMPPEVAGANASPEGDPRVAALTAFLERLRRS